MRHLYVHGNRRAPDRTNGGFGDGVGANAQDFIIPARDVERLCGWVLEKFLENVRGVLVGEISAKEPLVTIRRWELEAGMVQARSIQGAFSP